MWTDRHRTRHETRLKDVVMQVGLTSAQAVLTELATNPTAHEIAFTDVIMQGMNGVGLGREIRRLYPNIPVVLTSGYSHVLARNAEHGFELLQKLYLVEALSRILVQAMGQRKADPTL